MVGLSTRATAANDKPPHNSELNNRQDQQMTQREVVVVGAARTAVGSFGGSRKDVPMTTLASTAGKAALERSGAAAEQIGHVVMGNVIPNDPRDAYLSRAPATQPGIPHEPPASNT